MGHFTTENDEILKRMAAIGTGTMAQMRKANKKPVDKFADRTKALVKNGFLQILSRNGKYVYSLTPKGVQRLEAAAVDDVSVEPEEAPREPTPGRLWFIPKTSYVPPNMNPARDSADIGLQVPSRTGNRLIYRSEANAV